MLMPSIIVFLLSCAVYTTSEAFLRIQTNPEVNNAIRGIESDIADALRDELQKTLRFTSCADTNTNLTKYIDGVLISFIDIHICGIETKELLNFETDLEFGGLHFRYKFDKIYLKSKFQVQIAQSQNHETFDGFRLVLEDVVVDGSTGFLVDGTNWKSSSWTQEVKPERIYIEGYNGNDKRVELSPETFHENSLGRYLQFEAYNLIWKQLENDINGALRIVPVTEIFTRNTTLLGLYRTQIAALNKFANSFIDKLLEETREYVMENNQQVTTIPNYETKFTRRWGLITLWGDLRARGGSMKDLSTMKRTANFTILPMKKQKQIKVFGAVGLQQLSFGYEHYEARVWNIGPTGTIEADTGKNSIAFSMKGRYEKETGNFDVKKFIVNIVEFENLQIKATGLGPFNWLYSIMLSRMADDSKDDILPIIEETIEETLATKITQGLSFNGFESFVKVP